MLRSAHCLGADGVLASAKNCAPLSAVVSKASSGALEVMTLHNTPNLPRTLADAAEQGWEVVGAAGERDATPIAEFKVERPTLLVMGEWVMRLCWRGIGGDDALTTGRRLPLAFPLCLLMTRLCSTFPQPALYTARFHKDPPPSPTPKNTPTTGNEGTGLRTNVRRACTSKVKIEMGAAAGSSDVAPSVVAAAVDSLNVSVAAGILLHHMLAASKAG